MYGVGERVWWTADLAAKGVSVGSLAGGERQDAGSENEGRNDGNSRARAGCRIGKERMRL